MAKLASISINLSKIDKSKIIEGKKGKYLNVTILISDELDQRGNDVSCWQGQSKEEREAKTDRNYLGNGRVVWRGESNSNSEPKVTSDDDDLPF